MTFTGRFIRRNIIGTTFDSLGLEPELLRAVADQGYTQPTPIQVQAIPVVLSGRDLLGAAQTGTGKTAGFTLPLLQRLAASAPAGRPSGSSDAPSPVRALVLTPTRELAAQVEDSIRTYGAHMPLSSAVIYGGVGMQPQVDALRRGVDILVATPGRLLDHVQQGTLDLGRVQILVLDEADRMLDMGFIHDIRRVLALLPGERQNLLFSATFSNEIIALAGTFLRDPVTVEVARRNTPAELVAQAAYPVDAGRKRDLLAHLVKSNDWHQVLVFVRTKHGANRLAEQLARAGVEADAIHGNKSQGARTRALARFKDGSLRVLVATDIAARGLDIEELPHVVNYDLPHVPHDYVHRIGRTGRAGSVGEALSLVSHEERPLLAAIEKLINRTIERRVVPGFEPGTAPAQPAPANTGPQRAEQRDGEPGGRRRRGRRRQEGRGNPPHPARPNEPRRGQQPQRPPRGARPAGPRNEHRVYADHDEREAQLREARMRLAEERGETEQEGNRRERTKPVAALLNNPRRDAD